MRLNSVAKRYAEALFNQAKAQNKLDIVMRDYNFFETLSFDYESIRDVIKSPIVSKQVKKNIIKDLFGKYLDEISLNCIYLIIDKNREDITSCFFEEFLKIYNEYNSISNLVIESVILLSEDQKAKIKSILERKLNKKFTVTNVINESLMGGVRLLIDDKIIDGSVKAKLTEISECLVN